VNAFCETNEVDKATSVAMESISDPDTRSSTVFTPIVYYWLRKEDFAAAHEIVEKIIKNGILPNDRVFMGLIKVHCAHNLPDAHDWLDRMRSLGAPRERDFYFHLISQILGECGEQEALSFLPQMQKDGVPLDFGFCSSFYDFYLAETQNSNKALKRLFAVSSLAPFHTNANVKRLVQRKPK